MCSIASMSWYNDNARFFQVFYYNDIASVCLCVFGRYACVFETCCDSHRYVEPPCCCIYIYTIYSLQVFVINPRWLGEGPLRQHDANKIKKTCTSIRAKGNDKTLYIHTCAIFFFYKMIKPMPPMSLFHLFYFQRRFFWIDVQWPVFFLPFGS